MTTNDRKYAAKITTVLLNISIRRDGTAQRVWNWRTAVIFAKTGGRRYYLCAKWLIVAAGFQIAYSHKKAARSDRFFMQEIKYHPACFNLTGCIKICNTIVAGVEPTIGENFHQKPVKSTKWD